MKAPSEVPKGVGRSSALQLACPSLRPVAPHLLQTFAFVALLEALAAYYESVGQMRSSH